MPLGRVGIQQAGRRPAANRRGQLPAQVHRVADAQVQALAAERRVHVRRVAGQQHAPQPIGAGLTGVVGEPGRGADRGDVDVDAR